jgi:hypothetical protein
MRLMLALALAPALGAASCLPPPCRPSDEPTLEVGLGEYFFTPMTDPIPFVQGAQGGYHVAMAVRTTGLEMGGLGAVDLVGVVDGETVADVSPWLRLVCEDEAQQAAGLLMIFDVGPEALGGAVLEGSVTARDVDGREVSASFSGTLALDGG